MSKTFIISGSSKGLGRALTELLVEEGQVIGLSRTNEFDHKNFHWIQVDFANPEELDNINLNIEGGEVVLINNAGWIGPVNKIGKQKTKEIVDLFNVNVSSLFVLTNKVIQSFKNLPLTVINISSGAATNPIDGWGAYCSSKAAVDMFSFILDQEMKMEGRSIRVYALSPGVIDTPMQAEIRTASSEQFSRIEDFKSMKESGDLVQPEDVALKVKYLIDNPAQFQEVKVSVRDY